MNVFSIFRQAKCLLGMSVSVAVLTSSASAQERINHEGRILGDVPPITSPILFNTPEADAVISSLQIFPVDSAWNEDISRRPLLPNSDAMIAKIMSELQADRRTLRAFYEMNFAIVPPNQPLVPIEFFNYPDESDPGPYPIPSNLPVEGWPKETGDLTLSQWQEDVTDQGGDRHSIIIQPSSGYVWETWLTKRTGNQWEASNGARFDLNSNATRPRGWTSADAAGLSMFAGLVRYDECERGMVEHALRLIVKHTRREYIYPATHHASVPSTTDPNVPAMGQRLRLKADYVIPENWTKYEKAILRALKKYGAIIADNGNFFSISVAPDQRFPANAFEHLRSLSISSFEVIQTTGPTDGPRSAGQPTANAGVDRTVGTGEPVTLTGAHTGDASAQVQWKVYAGPGGIAFTDPSKTNSVVTFDKTGKYTLLLSVANGIHPVAYDAVNMTVEAKTGVRVEAQRQGTDVALRWNGGAAPYIVERSEQLSSPRWENVLETNGTEATVSMSGKAGYFRVRSSGQP